MGSYVRNSFGNRVGFVTPADVARVRAATAGRQTSWTVTELAASLPAQLFTDGWRVTASHNSGDAIGALTLTGWNAGAPQQAGMWFQIEMPAARAVTEVQFLSPSASPDGRGAAVTRTGAPANVADTLGFPRQYKVEVSTDGSTWRAAAEGAAAGQSTTITFPSAEAKLIRMTLTGGTGPAWSMQDLRVLALPGK